MTEGRIPDGTVTLLLADVEGSVRLWESMPADAGNETTSYRELIARTVAAHDGALPLEQGEGDAFVAAFRRASDALRCAVEIQLRLAEVGAPARPRMALHTGDVEIADGVSYMGPTINRCARMRDVAHGGQILLSRASYDVVADTASPDVTFVDLGSHRLRDLARPEQMHQVVHPALPENFPSLKTPDARRTNIPAAVTSFVGREAEIDEIRALIAGARLVTLTGPGGCGKTRLALEVAGRVLDDFGDGVWIADLAPLSEPAHVLERVGRAVGLRSDVAGALTTDGLAHYLETKEALIVLDNCEHLVGTTAVIASALLERCSSIRLLATSREPLGVAGESAWRVPPLDAPGEEAPLDAVAKCDAVELFVERARQVRPNFELDASNAATVASICRRLDGLPLAIELAAARLKMLSPEKIADALADRFRLLSGGARTAVRRQQTLRASLDWSYDLLDDAEAAVLRRLAAFAGGFTLEAAEDVCASEGVDRYEVFDIVGRLVDRSLVLVAEDATDRFRLLESIWEYAEEKLAASGEAEATRSRHRDHYLALAERVSPGLYASDEGILGVLRTERENLRAALRWTDERREDVVLLRLVGAMAPYWDIAGPYGEARHWLSLAFERNPDAPAELLGRARFGAAMIAMDTGDPATVIVHAERGMDIARELGDLVLEGRCLVPLGLAFMFSGRAAEAPELLERALAMGEQHGDGFAVAFARQALGILAGNNGDYARAIELHQKGIAKAREMGNAIRADINTMFLAYDYFFVGRLREAAELLESIYHRAELNRFARGIERSIAASTHLCLGNYDVALEHAQEALDMAQTELANELFEALASLALADVKLATDGPDAVGNLIDHALEVADDSMPLFTISVLTQITEFELARGQVDAARRYADRARGVADRSGLRWFAGRAALNSARVAAAAGETQVAFRDAVEAVTAQAKMPDRVGAIWSLELLASLATTVSSFEDAARLWGASQALRDEIGFVMYPSWRPAFEADVARARDAMAAEAFELAWAEGTRMSMQEAAVYASKRRFGRKRPATGWASLSPIERQVVNLVAEGLTNPQIGERLFISKRTVQAHLARIFPKIGVTSRAQLAAEATKVNT